MVGWEERGRAAGTGLRCPQCPPLLLLLPLQPQSQQQVGEGRLPLLLLLLLPPPLPNQREVAAGSWGRARGS